MNCKPYYMAHSCPNCGLKDGINEWGGARTFSTAWGHDFSCCSDECGFEFKKKYDELAKTKKGRQQLSNLWTKLAGESDALLCGEPYYGWKAEQMLKSRRFN